MKNVLLALAMVLLLSVPAMAVEGRVTPALPQDYNGNIPPCIWDGYGWLLDTGAVTTVISVTDTITVQTGGTPLAVTGTITAVNTIDTGYISEVRLVSQGNQYLYDGSGWIPDSGASTISGTATFTNGGSPLVVTENNTDTPGQVKLYGWESTTSQWMPLQITSTTYPVLRTTMTASGVPITGTVQNLDNMSGAGTGLNVNGFQYCWNDSNSGWDKIRSVSGQSGQTDTISTTAPGSLTSSRIYGWDPALEQWSRLAIGSGNTDSTPILATGAIYTMSAMYALNNGNDGFDRIHGDSAVGLHTHITNDTISTTSQIINEVAVALAEDTIGVTAEIVSMPEVDIRPLWAGLNGGDSVMIVGTDGSDVYKLGMNDEGAIYVYLYGAYDPAGAAFQLASNDSASLAVDAIRELGSTGSDTYGVTTFAAATATITLDQSYPTIYVSADTDVLVKTNGVPVDCGSGIYDGQLIEARQTVPFSHNTTSVSAITVTGLTDGAAAFRVRAARK
ncbi:MAG: hypothetical protein WC551_10615 [Patescibacteria group bacterium]